jgi:hypothetical protein
MVRSIYDHILEVNWHYLFFVMPNSHHLWCGILPRRLAGDFNGSSIAQRVACLTCHRGSHGAVELPETEWQGSRSKNCKVRTILDGDTTRKNVSAVSLERRAFQHVQRLIDSLQPPKEKTDESQ